MTRILKLSFGIFCLSLSFGLNAMALECFRCPLTGEIYGEFEEGTCGGDCLNWFLPVACERLFDSECELSDEYDFLNCDGSTYQTFPDDVDFICDQPDNICEGQIGGPVNLANGSMWYRPDADVSLNNPFPFEVRRGYWSTAAQRDHDRNIMHPLGWGWRINFYEWMEIKGAENDLAGIHRWNGALDRFYIREDHPQWKPEDGKHQKFSPVANGYELIDEDGISRIYEGSGIGEKFVMTSIAPFDVPEQAVQICYSTESDPTSPTSTCSCGAGSNTNVEGKPCQVKPASGPPIDVHWTRTTLSNKLVISSLSIGVVTVASYEYDSNDNLQYYYRGDTSSPEDWKYTYSYEYSHGLLHKVETPEIPTSTGSSPARIKAEEHEWTCSSSSGPCEVTRTKTPIEDYSITYASIPPDPLDPLAVATHKAIVTNNNVSPPLVYTIKFNGRGLPVEMSPASACRSPVSKYEYDDESVEKDGESIIWPGANIRAIQYADGSWTSFNLGVSGKPTKIQYGDSNGNPNDALVGSLAPIEMTWHPTLRRPLSISRESVEVMALFSNEEGSVTVFDYGDPIISCSPGSCTGSLGKEDFNQGTLGSQLQRIIRFGVTLEATITPFPREAHVQQFSYDLEGRLWKIEGPLADQLVTLEYWDDLAPIHKQGRLKNRKVRVTTTSELVTTFNDYDMFGNPLSVTFTRLPKNNPTEADETWSLSYYENGRLETIQNPNGQTWTYNYTPAGTIESIVSPEGNTTKSSYDVNGLLAAVGRYPSSSSSAVWDETELSYDSRGNTTKIEYKKNAVTKLRSTYGYDDRDRLAWEGIWRNGPSVPHYYKVYGYNAGWQIASVTDANHAIDPEDIANANLQYDYHPSGELLSVKRKVSNNFEMESRFASDNRGNINSTLDSETRLSIYLHDDFDRLVMTGGPAPVAYLYDAANRLVNRYEIIHMGSYNSDVPIAADEEIVYQYDLANRLIAKNGNGLQWNAVFDAAPQTVTKCFGGGTISLENRGWRLARVTRNDTELAFGYDVSGRLLHEARQAPGKNCYHVFSRTYTDNGQLATLTYPSGRIVEYIYPESSLIGDVDRPIQLKMMLGTIETILLDGIVYQAGKPHQWTDSSGLKTTVTWNLDGTVAERIVENCPEGSCSTPPSIFFNWNVSDRDGVGNVTEIISMYPGGLLPVETAFSYTEQYFLESRTQLCLLCKNLFFEYTNSGELSYEHSSAFVLFSDSSRDFSYNDFLIDRIDITTGATAVERFIQYNHAPGDTRIASKLMMESPMFPEKWSARYTVDGFLDRLHHESNFDFDTGVAQTNDYRYYTYDGLDRRSLRSTTASGVARTREFWNDNKIFSEIDIKNRRISKIKSILSSGLEWSGKYRDYIYLGDEAIAVTDGDWSCRSETTAGACDLDMSIIDSEIYYIHKDHLGSAILLTDMDQNEVLRISYTPFGEATLTGSVEYNPRRPGQYQDNDFVYYNGYRYYEPSTGRYLQPEPLYQNPEAVQAYAVAGYPLNPYAYAANNPLRFVDPSGLYFDYSYLGWLDSLSARWALFWLRRNKDIGHLIDELDESPHPIYFQNIDKQDPLGGGTYPIKGCQGAFIKYDLWNGRRLLDDERIPKHLRIPMAQTGLEEYLAHELGHAYVIINGGLINGSVVDTNDVSLEWENSVRRPKGGKLRLDHDIKLP